MDLSWIIHALDTELSNWSTADVVVSLRIVGLKEGGYEARLVGDDPGDPGATHEISGPRGEEFRAVGDFPTAAVEELEKVCKRALSAE